LSFFTISKAKNKVKFKTHYSQTQDLKKIVENKRKLKEQEQEQDKKEKPKENKNQKVRGV